MQYSLYKKILYWIIYTFLLHSFAKSDPLAYIFECDKASVYICNSTEEFVSDSLTCLAAIREEPTTFPLESSTSIPSESSLCLIRATLQTFALAVKKKRGNGNISAPQHTWRTSVCQCYSTCSCCGISMKYLETHDIAENSKIADIC